MKNALRYFAIVSLDNPTLIALRRELDVARQRPAQNRTLAPPTLEAMVWQWPLDTVNPLNTNMYIFTVRQDIPGPGKRALREAVTKKDVERATNDIAARAREVIAQVKRAYSELFVTPVIFYIMKVRALRKGTLRPSSMAH